MNPIQRRKLYKECEYNRANDADYNTINRAIKRKNILAIVIGVLIGVLIGEIAFKVLTKNI